MAEASDSIPIPDASFADDAPHKKPASGAPASNPAPDAHPQSGNPSLSASVHVYPTPATAWLAAFLADGECPAPEVYVAGKRAGFSQNQLQYAYYRLGAQSRLHGFPQKAWWRLAESEPPKCSMSEAPATIPVPAVSPRDDEPFPPGGIRRRQTPAAAWLSAFLADGERPASEACAAGKEVGFSSTQLARARHRLGVQIQFRGNSMKSYWRLDAGGPSSPGRIPSPPVEWLAAYMAEGERLASEGYAAGRAAGFSGQQLKRARQRLGVQIHFRGNPMKSYWRLPDAGGGPSSPSGIPPPPVAWLAAFMADGERLASEGYAAGRAAGFSGQQLKRARRRLGVELHSHGSPPEIYWRLTETAPSVSIPTPATIWLTSFLADGERPALEVYATGKATGFSLDQLTRARRRLGVQIRFRGSPPKSFWRLAEGTPSEGPASESSASAPTPATTWLTALLADGERPASKAYVAGKVAGFSEHQLRRARHHLGVQIRRAGFPPIFYWRLAPPPEVPAPQSAGLG